MGFEAGTAQVGWGIAAEPMRKTVCCRCCWDAERDEGEGAAEMRPWARLLSFWVGYFGWRRSQMRRLPSSRSSGIANTSARPESVLPGSREEMTVPMFNEV